MGTIEDYLNRLPGEKLSSTDLDDLSFEELGALVGEKVAMVSEKASYGGCDANWIDQFVGTPLHAKAIALVEAELKLEQERLQRQMENEARHKSEDNLWTQCDAIRLEKRILELELHRQAAGAQGGQDPTMVPAEKVPAEELAKDKEKTSAKIPEAIQKGLREAQIKDLKKVVHRLEGAAAGSAVGGLMGGLVGHRAGRASREKTSAQTTGEINNGDPRSPSWPEAALRDAVAPEAMKSHHANWSGSVETPQHVDVKSAGLLAAVEGRPGLPFRRSPTP